METIEIWKDYGLKYEVSNLGNIRNKFNKVYLKLSYSFGYAYCNIKTLEGQKRVRLHRIVGKVFINNYENKPCINHINGIKTDNRVVNLEWCTIRENNLHKFRVLGAKPNKTGTGKFGCLNVTSKPIEQWSLDGELIKKYDAINTAERETGIQSRQISNCLCKRQKTAKGFIWKYQNV